MLMQVRDAILHAIELQKLRSIELEPEPDYAEPLTVYDPDNNQAGNNYENSYSGLGVRRGSTDVRMADDAISLASEPLAFHGGQYSQSQCQGAYGHVRHNYLVRPSVVDEPSHYQGGLSAWADQGRNNTGVHGPLCNFTLQRTFEKRFCNVQAGARQSGTLASPADAAAMFQGGSIGRRGVVLQRSAQDESYDPYRGYRHSELDV
jgi:hypothetical protein